MFTRAGNTTRSRRRRGRHDRGSADPILVVAAVAVSLLLLVAGSFNLHAIGIKAQDKNARNDLSELATAEASYFSTQQTYVNYDSVTNPTALSGDSISFNPTTHVAVLACNSGWVAAAQSLSGTVITETNMSSTFGDSTGTGLTLPSCAGSDYVTNAVAFATSAQTMSGCTVAPTPTVGLAGTTTSTTQSAFTISATYTWGQSSAGWTMGTTVVSSPTAVTNVRIWIDGVEYCGVASGTVKATTYFTTTQVALVLNLSTLDASLLARFQASGRVQFDYGSFTNNTVRL